MALSPNGSKDFLHGAVLAVRTIGLFAPGTFQGAADKCGMGMYNYLEALKEFEKEHGESCEKTD